jgi:hypothetical protein
MWNSGGTQIILYSSLNKMTEVKIFYKKTAAIKLKCNGTDG